MDRFSSATKHCGRNKNRIAGNSNFIPKLTMQIETFDKALSYWHFQKLCGEFKFCILSSLNVEKQKMVGSLL